MTTRSVFRILGLAFVLAFFAGCATQQKAVDYTAFKQSRPRSILILPPVNNSPDVAASYSVLSQMTYPLAEAGYYVFPVTLVSETFKENGLTEPTDIQAVDPRKLHDIFGADAALYVTVDKYGATYTVFNSVCIVQAHAKLVDLRSGLALWSGSASASNDEGQNGNNGLIAGLIGAIVKQILNTSTDASHQVAGLASYRLLSAGHANGILYGPRSPKYQTD